MSYLHKPRLRVPIESPDPWFDSSAMMTPALLFLDFDGVLHPLGPKATRFECAEALGRCLDLIDPSGARIGIALTTTWRFQPWELILSEMAKASPNLSARLEGRCGRLATRRDEVLDYLLKRPAAASVFAALDDQPCLFGPENTQWLVACDPSTGFNKLMQESLSKALIEVNPSLKI